MQKKPIIIFIFSLLIISLFSFVAYSISIDQPAESGTLTTASKLLNVSIGTGHQNVNITSVRIGFTCTDNGNTSYTELASNTTNNATTYIMSWDNSLAEDSSNCNFNATAYNGTVTNEAFTDNSSSVIIDNFEPTQPTSLSPSGTQSSNSYNFTATVTGTKTTGCQLVFLGANPMGTDLQKIMTHSSDTCYLTVSSLIDWDYEYKIIATDGVDNNATTQTLKIDAVKGGGGVPVQISQGTGVNLGTTASGGKAASIVGDLFSTSGSSTGKKWLTYGLILAGGYFGYTFLFGKSTSYRRKKKR